MSSPSVRLPFQNMPPQAWGNIGLVAVFSLYLALYIFPLWQGSLLISLGADYRAFWSAGYIANHWNYAEIYSLERLIEVQQHLTYSETSPFLPVVPMPAPYPPVFLVPFQVMAFLPITVSFWLWQVINWGGIIMYLYKYIDRLGPGVEGSRISLLLLGLLFMPVFTNFWEGQLGLWLMICVGEFVLLMKAGKSFWAGIWLSGLLLKPQVIVLIMPALFFQRAWKTVLGFTLGAVVLSGISVFMLGVEGVQNFLTMLGFWGAVSSPIAVINPDAMINWRMIGLHLSAFFPDWIAWGAAGLGAITTVIIALWMWRKPIEPNSVRFGVALFGLISATSIATWHSHQHTLMLLVPVFLFLWVKNEIPLLLKYLWLFVLPLSIFFTYLVVAIIFYGGFSFDFPVGAFITGTAGLFLGVVFLLWSFQKMQGAND